MDTEDSEVCCLLLAVFVVCVMVVCVLLHFSLWYVSRMTSQA